MESSPHTYDFSLSSSEGALLILPKGAENYKLRKRQIFRDVATRHAADWYNFAEQHLGRIITRDSLYLITGLYKTSFWSAAAFHQATGNAESTAQFKASHAGGGDGVSYTWETMRALDWRVGPQIDVGIPNQSVFINGYKIAIREGILGKRRVEIEMPRLLTRGGQWGSSTEAMVQVPPYPGIIGGDLCLEVVAEVGNRLNRLRQ